MSLSFLDAYELIHIRRGHPPTHPSIHRPTHSYLRAGQVHGPHAAVKGQGLVELLHDGVDLAAEAPAP